MSLIRVFAKSLHTSDLLLSKADGVSLVKSLPPSEYDFLLLLSSSVSSVFFYNPAVVLGEGALDLLYFKYSVICCIISHPSSPSLALFLKQSSSPVALFGVVTH